MSRAALASSDLWMSAYSRFVDGMVRGCEKRVTLWRAVVALSHMTDVMTLKYIVKYTLIFL